MRFAEILWNAQGNADPIAARRQLRQYLDQNEFRMDAAKRSSGRYLLRDDGLCGGTESVRLRPLPRIFVSYRRAAARWAARLIAERLRDHWTDEAVFLDADDIRPGEPFPERLRRQIRDSAALVAVVTPQWMPPARSVPSGAETEQAGTDWVREEIQTALGAGVPIVPLLIDGAHERELQWDETLRGLNACVLDAGPDFEAQITRVALAVEQAVNDVHNDWHP